MVTTKERSPMAASIVAVAKICASAPTSTHGQNMKSGRGSATPVATEAPARKTRTKGKPKRKRTWVAPTVPRLPVSSRCMALRAVCAAAASTLNRTQSQLVSFMEVLWREQIIQFVTPMAPGFWRHVASCPVTSPDGHASLLVVHQRQEIEVANHRVAAGAFHH